VWIGVPAGKLMLRARWEWCIWGLWVVGCSSIRRANICLVVCIGLLCIYLLVSACN
jgi:hypothetical protein